MAGSYDSTKVSASDGLSHSCCWADDEPTEGKAPDTSRTKTLRKAESTEAWHLAIINNNNNNNSNKNTHFVMHHISNGNFESQIWMLLLFFQQLLVLNFRKRRN